MTTDAPDTNPPVVLRETTYWREVAQLAAARGLRLEITVDPIHPLNPWLRLTDEPKTPPSVTA
jgi:hypothetical protein